MNGQLTVIVDELRAAQDSLHDMYSRLPADAWRSRPGSDRWSAAECLVHLNMTSAALLPLVRSGLTEARHATGRSRYRRNFIGWLVAKAIAPGSYVRIATTPAFVPKATSSIAELVDEFDRLQSEIVACVEAAHGLALDRVTLVSPFHGRVKYNLYAAMTLIPRHQQRHLLQAATAATEATVSDRLAAAMAV